MRRRLICLSGLFPLVATAQSQPLPQPSPVDSVALYLLPTDGVSEQGAAQIARAIGQDSGLQVRSTPWVAPGAIQPLAGGTQYPAEDYLALAGPVARQLQDTNARTYFIVLTDQDINARAQTFRFQFSMHSPNLRTSVLSIARLAYGSDGAAVTPERLAARAQKMLMRIVGEMRLGWTRTADPTDLMHAPLVSVDDIDRLDLVESVRRRRQQP